MHYTNKVSQKINNNLICVECEMAGSCRSLRMVCEIFLWLTQKKTEKVSHLAACLPKYLIKTYMRQRIGKAKEFTKLKCVSVQWHGTCLEILCKMRLSPTPVSSTKIVTLLHGIL